MSKRPVRRMLARLVIKGTGWKPEGVRPEAPRFVLIAAPHTTNWDFLYLIAFAEYFEIQISFMAKHTLFRGPMGLVMRALGGIAVRRHRRENLVTTLARLFEENERLGLVVPAEGTRGYVDYWKSGFYHIAKTAEVPIVMSFLDYERKVGGFGEGFHPTEDLLADMDQIRKFYGDKKGKYPELFGRIRLREEDELEGRLRLREEDELEGRLRPREEDELEGRLRPREEDALEPGVTRAGRVDETGPPDAT